MSHCLGDNSRDWMGTGTRALEGKLGIDERSSWKGRSFGTFWNIRYLLVKGISWNFHEFPTSAVLH
jgi:hypothetical protein